MFLSLLLSSLLLLSFIPHNSLFCIKQNPVKGQCKLDPNPVTTTSNHMTFSTLGNFSGFIFSYKKWWELYLPHGILWRMAYTLWKISAYCEWSILYLWLGLLPIPVYKVEIALHAATHFIIHSPEYILLRYLTQ